MGQQETALMLILHPKCIAPDKRREIAKNACLFRTLANDNYNYVSAYVY